jgi:hypothetical protein
MIITFWLVVQSMTWFLYFYMVLRSMYDLQIVLGAIIMGLGVVRVFQEYKMKEYDRRMSNQVGST